MELQQVRYFLVLSRTLNFTRAAQACNVTQPALTRAVQRLEEELGGPLLYRERTLTQLTERGRALLPSLQAMARAADATRQIADTLDQHTAILRIGLAGGIPAALIGMILRALISRFPRLELALHTEAQPAVIESLLQGETEAALTVDDGSMPDRLDRWPLVAETCQAVFPPGHRFEALPAVSLPALRSEPLIQCGQWGSAWPSLFGDGRKVRAGNWEGAQHLAAAGLGVVPLPAYVAVLPGLTARPVAEALTGRSVVLTAMNGRMRAPVLDAFIKLTRARRIEVGT